MADNGADHRRWLEIYLPTYRDELLRMGIAKETVNGMIRWLWTEPTIKIRTMADYKHACLLHEQMANGVAKGDAFSPQASRLYALGGEMIRFEEEYEEKHGRLPNTE